MIDMTKVLREELNNVRNNLQIATGRKTVLMIHAVFLDDDDDVAPVGVVTMSTFPTNLSNIMPIIHSVINTVVEKPAGANHGSH